MLWVIVLNLLIVLGVCTIIITESIFVCFMIAAYQATCRELKLVGVEKDWNGEERISDEEHRKYAIFRGYDLLRPEKSTNTSASIESGGLSPFQNDLGVESLQNIQNIESANQMWQAQNNMSHQDFL